MIPIPSEQLSLLEQHYLLREPADVLAFLEKTPFLVPLLLELSPKLKKHFPGSAFFLQVFIGPEDDPDKLLVGIITSLLFSRQKMACACKHHWLRGSTHHLTPCLDCAII
jgi:hypothetical protein